MFAGKEPGGTPGTPACFACGKKGHIAKNCTKAGASRGPTPQRCLVCGKPGHTKENCWSRPKRVGAVMTECPQHSSMTMECGCSFIQMSAACTPECDVPGMPVAKGYVNGTECTILRDSGCSAVIVRRGLVASTVPLTGSQLIRFADGSMKRVPTTQVFIDCPYYQGRVEAALLEAPLYDVMLGNIKGVKCPGLQIETESYSRKAAAMETRASSTKEIKKLKTPQQADLGLSREDLKDLQQEDPSLEQARRNALTGDIIHTGKDNESWYSYQKGILVRHFKSPKVEHGDVVKQVVVPASLRSKVMALGHDSILAGHLAAKKTAEKILTNFYWPNLWGDVTRYCQSCDVCQRSTPKGRTTKVPLEKMPIIDQPFTRVAVDLIGPIQPSSERGNRYVLTLVDFSTRYPEAVALKNMTTETVAEALVDIFSRVGLPKEILSDCGTQFTSDLMKEVCRLLSIKQLTTTPYHPQTNGLVERFNGTIKSIIKKLTSERPRDWDRYLPAALFAYRESPQESLGFAPFELMFGRTVRGPMAVLRQLWTEDCEDPDIKTTYQFVMDLQERLEQTVSFAKENLEKSAARYRQHFDKRAKPRTFSVGDQVLLLLPKSNNKLQVSWQGPFKVLEAKGHNNYKVQMGDREKTFHVNILKRYHNRTDEDCGEEAPERKTGALQCAVSAIVPESEEVDEMGSEDSGEKVKNILIETPSLRQTESIEDIEVFSGLALQQRKELEQVLKEFSDVFTDVPGQTHLMEHDIPLTSTDPIRRKPYPVPQSMRQSMREEVDNMIQAGIIEPSSSPYCSPSVIVSKKDGTNRYCIDFRALNNITIFDAEPMVRPDDLFQEIGSKSCFLTKVDLSKGYWQIPLTEAAKPCTAFATEKGLYQFRVMPFGLQGAPATFARLMRKVTDGLPNHRNYLDDCLIFTETWEEHLRSLRALFKRLREAGLTARPSKCCMAYPRLEFLGHMVGSGSMTSSCDKVGAIRDAKPPRTKKEMRSFLGLASFYRRYVPHFSTISSPLTDATRKGKPNTIIWEEAQLNAFRNLKAALTSKPVLKLPDFEKPFILSTDASDTGLGAILKQDHDGEKFPVVYLSRKLLPREQRYSVVEKECLALVWAVKSLNTYLWGRQFVIETDHAPLLYLNKARSENGRLMRWALLLSQYRFQLKSVKGKDNHGPDFLSRKE
ncbi:reverse transcriptase [Elysia marginata]|uniref:Reverse transcriptase n=1 Tax=Elysia marginata TaxID=1093978 RepID=A0AAV4FY64_9GAST|nr:reverse transcriptase [Elysia marginata]